jgi:hypothetical protein
VEDLLVNVTWVNKFFREIIVQSKDLWEFAYVRTWSMDEGIKLYVGWGRRREKNGKERIRKNKKEKRRNERKRRKEKKRRKEGR